MTIAALTTVVRADHMLGPSQGHWTYATYAELPSDGARYEVIDGVLYMSPAPIPEHEQITMLIGARFVSAVHDTGLGQVFGSPDIDFGDTILRPDVVAVLTANQGIVTPKKLIGPPDLVVEAISPSTADYDRDDVVGKRGAYARASVPEYWIVDPVARTIEVLELVDAAYKQLGVYSGEERVISNIIPSLELKAAQYFPR